MRRKNRVEIKRPGTLWTVYDITKDGLELSREEVMISGKPECKTRQVAAPIAKGHVVFTMAYDEFVKNAKSEFIKEETNNAD